MFEVPVKFIYRVFVGEGLFSLATRSVVFGLGMLYIKLNAVTLFADKFAVIEAALFTFA